MGYGALCSVGSAVSLLLALLLVLPLRFEAEAPYPGARGLTCHGDFHQLEGNAQSLCPDGYEGVILYPLAYTSPEMLANIIAHEHWHWTHRDRLGEAEAYRAGCLASWVPECLHWQAAHPLTPATVVVNLILSP